MKTAHEPRSTPPSHHSQHPNNSNSLLGSVEKHTRVNTYAQTQQAPLTVQHEAALARVPGAAHLAHAVREARVEHGEAVEGRGHARDQVLKLHALGGEAARRTGQGGTLQG